MSKVYLDREGKCHDLAEERVEVDGLRDKVLQYLISETEAFYKRFPHLQVNWSFGLDATLREEKP